MITVPLIHWQPIATIPRDRRDGRQMLLWSGGAAEIGFWIEDGFEGPGWADKSEALPIKFVSHWADINPPA